VSAALPRRLAAEGLGTALLLAAVVGSGIMGERLAAGNDAVALLANSIATGGALFALIVVLAPVSGAHFNPLVTLVAVASGEIAGRDALAYVATQVVAAVAGVILAHVMFDLPLLQASVRLRTGAGQWIAEAVATFGLILVIAGTARRGVVLVAATVALYIMAAYWFTASTSFANPAVTLARSLTATFSGIQPGDVAAFVAAQAVGALAAQLVSRRLFDLR
jgi:glycerol uptake facilitator-like aquaporin